MHFDLPDHDQPGDRDEAVARDDFAEELARYINRYPARHIPLRQRVQTFADCVSDDELDRLVPAVDYFLGLYDRHRVKVQA
jgi:hypothetical protein